MVNTDIKDKTRELFAKPKNRTLDDEEIRQILANITGFFDTLADWQQKIDNQKKEEPADVNRSQSLCCY